MIEVSGLSKTFGSTKAVDQLSFTVNPGTVTGFLGPNGAGKSTTMRMILGLDNPTSGQALIDGQRYASLQQTVDQGGRAARRELGASEPFRPVAPALAGHLQWIARASGSTRCSTPSA